jgi:uncharacterized protein (DUF58 family)
MGELRAFHYRLPHRAAGQRPGSHPGTSLGVGQEFVSHARLFDRPDPRRLDLRASVRNLGGDWLVRVNRQRAGIPVQVIADVSSSMRFGSHWTKLDVAADFVESLGQSAFRVGDALGMRAFDSQERADLFMPALLSRGMGSVLAAMLRRCGSRPGGIEGLLEAATPLAGRQGLVFLVSDFHWPLDRLNEALDLLGSAWLVPMIVWDPAEIEPPAHDTLAALTDAESGVRRTLWLGAKARGEWREAVARRKAELERAFMVRNIRPFYAHGTFDGEAMSQYFFEATA